MKKICVVTGTRADYGLLVPLLRKLDKASEFQLQLLITGMHLSDLYGNTIQEIVKDSFPIARKVDILLASRSPVSVGKSLGLGVISFVEAFDELKPDLLVLLGDRFEILAAAQGAMVLNIPIAHIHGGELTFGAMDDAIRHSITKMSHLHFVSTDSYRDRVIRLGERPERVHNVGALGIDRINELELLGKKALEEELQKKDLGEYFLVTFHPVTLDRDGGVSELNELLSALRSFTGRYRFIFTMPNSDPHSDRIAAIIREFCETEKQDVYISLGSLRYLSLMKHSQGVIGNSSSGIIEAPYFKVPTIDVGQRQAGRARGVSVFSVPSRKAAIEEAIEKSQAADFRVQLRAPANPYGGGNAASLILDVLKSHSDFSALLEKGFYE